MDIPAPIAHVLRFGAFELDTTSGELRRHGLKIRFPDQSFQILKLLLSRPGELVTREELRHVLWTSETFVDFEVGLNSAVRKLREALNDSADNPRFVETLPRRGYRFVASVSAPAADSREPSAPPAPVSEVAPLPSRSVSLPPAIAVAPTPRAFRLTLRRAAGLLFVILVAAGAAAHQRGGFRILPHGADADPLRAVVVLPFENLTGDAAQDYFVDSVSDAVTVHLAQVAGLNVISRTTALQYRRTVKRLPEIGRDLTVDGVVSGTVARSGEHVRITAQLSRAATDRVVWAQPYEGELSYILTLQQRIASEIAVAAGQHAAMGRRTARSISPQAYDAYLKGRTAMGKQQHDAFRRAVGYFEEAVAIQPDFAEAYAALALVQVQFLFGGPLAPRETIPKAEAAARKALQLDDTLAQAHRALGQILSLYHWQWDEGERALRRAAVLQNGGEQAVSQSLIRRGRFAEAVGTAERERTLDPLSVNAQIDVGTAYRAAGRYDRAVDELRRALEMSPGNTRVHFQLGVTFVRMGRLEEAIRELEVASRPAHGHNSRIEAYLGYAYAAAGRTDEARAVLKELESHRREQYVSAFGVGLIHDALGEKGPALAAVQRACDERAVEFGQMSQYPPFRTIASEPGFQAVMRKVGLPR